MKRARSSEVAWTSTVLCSVACVIAAAAGACGDDATTTSTGGAGGRSASASTGSIAATSSTGLPATFHVTGVVTDGAAPVEGAVVMQGGASPDFVTGPDGTFDIELTTSLPGTPTVVASKEGFRAAGEEIVVLDGAPIELVLREAKPPDNVFAYEFGDPGTGDAAHDANTSYCGHCHTSYVKDFQTSAHAKATRDPWVQDLYAGVASAITSAPACGAIGGAWRAGLVPGAPAMTTMRCYVGAGVLPDLNACGGPAAKSCDDPALTTGKPTQFGMCADCHAPGMSGVPGGRNLHEATGIAFDDGNHCDVCHHVRAVDLAAPSGVAGALVLQRPREKINPSDPGSPLLQVMYGPLRDVPNFFMGGSYAPVFESAALCGACHEERQPALVPGATLDPARWPDGLPVHSTYSEWAESSFGTPGTPCQSCHMPPLGGMFNSIDVSTAEDASITFGFGRPPEHNRRHIFRGPLEGSPRLIDGALVVGASAAQEGTTLAVDVAIQNAGAGHAIPTGDPMRSLVLVVAARGCGKDFAASGGVTIGDGGGSTASGIAGSDAVFAGASVDWPAAASKASPGSKVRVVRPTGTFDDYPGVGFFANPSLAPEEKGKPVDAPVGEATVIDVNGTTIALSTPIATQAGDIVYLGEVAPSSFTDGASSIALAGAAGDVFTKMLVDPSGRRDVPHFRAVDVASDNRIPPQTTATTHHAFAIPPGCTAADVEATLLYRRAPLELERERGWNDGDFVVGSASASVPLIP